MSEIITFNLAKGLYHVQNARVYFEHITKQKEVKYERKHFFNLQINRLNGITSDLTAHLTTESARLLRQELESDTMVFEAIKDKMCLLNEKQRWEVENYIDKILNKK